jgi:ABC-type proline/glycine betaine transport system permease subunit
VIAIMDQRKKNLVLAGALALFALALFAYSIISIVNQAPKP